MLGPEFSIVDLAGRTDVPEVDETGRTFEENAILKAATISRVLPGLIVADDSGLEVDALGGAPGVYSARYAGAAATDSDNVAKLLADLHSAAVYGEPGAQFRCVIAVARRGETLRIFEGMVRGVIARHAAGETGFGYDPVFKPEGSNRTFAQMDPDEKNATSHRGRAVEQLRAFLLQGQGHC